MGSNAPTAAGPAIEHGEYGSVPDGDGPAAVINVVPSGPGAAGTGACIRHYAGRRVPLTQASRHVSRPFTCSCLISRRQPPFPKELPCS